MTTPQFANLSPEARLAVVHERLRLLSWGFYINGAIGIVMVSFFLFHFIFMLAFSFMPESFFQASSAYEQNQLDGEVSVTFEEYGAETEDENPAEKAEDDFPAEDTSLLPGLTTDLPEPDVQDVVPEPVSAPARAMEEGQNLEVETSESVEVFPRMMFRVFAVVIGMIILAGWTLGGLTVYAGRCIAKRKHRVFVLMMAGFNCLGVPYGTFLGVCTFLTLGSLDGRAEFEGGSSTPQSPTGHPPQPLDANG